MTNSFRPYHGPGVDSVPSENEYQEHMLGVKAAGAYISVIKIKFAIQYDKNKRHFV